jgi:CheY-like chemotaxis protein
VLNRAGRNDVAQGPPPLLVLVVDDEEPDRRYAARVVEKLGHSVAQARNVKEALDFCAAMVPDAILLDLVMPETDSYATCQRIRSQEWGKELAVYALTEDKSADPRHSFRAGFTAHLLKPLDLAELRALLRKRQRSAGARGEAQAQPRSEAAGLDIDASASLSGDLLALADATAVQRGYDPYSAVAHKRSDSRPVPRSMDEKRRRMREELEKELRWDDGSSSEEPR